MRSCDTNVKGKPFLFLSCSLVFAVGLCLLLSGCASTDSTVSHKHGPAKIAYGSVQASENYEISNLVVVNRETGKRYTSENMENGNFYYLNLPSGEYFLQSMTITTLSKLLVTEKFPWIVGSKYNAKFNFTVDDGDNYLASLMVAIEKTEENDAKNRTEYAIDINPIDGNPDKILNSIKRYMLQQ